MKKILIVLLSLALLLAFAACEWEPEEVAPPVEEEPSVEEEPVEAVEEVPWLTFENYGQLYSAIAEVMENDPRYDEAKNTAETVEYEEDAAAAEAPEAAPAAEESADAGESGMGGAEDYSTTNLQVEGVDEADIVKTDGEYIYILRDGQVTVVRAAGADTDVVGSFVVCSPDLENGYEEAREMYLDDGALDVIVYSYSWKDNGNINKTCLRRFDVSDPENLGAQVYEVAQDGYYLDSRLLDGVVYLISNYYIFTEPEEGDPTTYVPNFYDAKGKAESFPIEDIAGCPGFSDLQYAIVSAVDSENGDRLSQETVLGAGSTVYMNENNLYLANTRYEEQAGEPYTESVYQVVDYVSKNYTNIIRFAVDKGQVELKAFTELEGFLSDQFAMDEYEGNLRVALTSNSSSYKIYTDEEFGFTNYVWEEDSDHTDNSLYILDPDLHPLGQLTGLAENEWIRSVRFSGPVGYICTYESIDPLFAIDLSDPAAPEVLSALKIPGFSEYLHPWGEDRLIGLGYGTSEDGLMDCVKLSMFDCSDLTDVQEISVYPISDLWYSEALYNHKAVTASEAKNLICFPGDNGYLLFSYDEDAGFTPLAQVSLDEAHWFDWNSRGLWAGDFFYVASRCGVAVLSMEDYSLVKELYFDDATLPDNWLYIDE